MKYLLTLLILVPIAMGANSQTTGGTKTGQKKTQIAKQEKKRLQRGTGQYHGSKDTTPGSPMGTGGAGGDMSGSPAGSAIETDDQTSKAEVNKDSSDSAGDTANTSGTTQKKSAIKNTRSTHHKSRRY